MTYTRLISELYRTEAPLLQRFLRRFGPSVSSEDIAQESFSKLCSLAPDTIVDPRAYLFRTARNLALNALRREKASPIHSASTERLADAAAIEPNPEELCSVAQDFELVTAALATLSERHRTALLLFRVEGWSHREIGVHLGVSHRTVERYIADAISHCHLALLSR